MSLLLAAAGAAAALADDQPQTDIGRVSTGGNDTGSQAVPKPSATKDRAAAIEEKKQAPNIIEVQPLSEMIKLPDVNVGEALQRVPGISLETDTGEGRFVNIRGLDSDLNGTTYGGVRMPPSNPSSPFNGGRAVAFDVFPTGLVGGVEVTKTNRPDLDAEALGGTINMVPRSGDAEGGKPFVELTAGGGYENLRETPVYDFGITTGRSFSRDGDGLFSGPNAFSALVTAIYHQDGRGIDDVEEAYSDNQSLGVPDKLLTSIDFRRYQYQRETYGFASNFDAKADERNSFYLRLLWSGYLELKRDQHLTIGNMDGGCVPPPVGNPGDTPANCAPSSVYPNGFTSPAATFDMNLTDESERIDTQLAVVGGKSLVGDVLLEYHASVAQGRDVVNYNYGPDFTILNGGDSVAIAYDNNSNPNYPNYKTTDGTNTVNPANYALTDLSYSTSTDRDREWGGGLDGTLPVTAWNAPGELKFGLGARLRHKTHYENDPDYQPVPGSTPISLGSYANGPDVLFYNNIYNVGPWMNNLGIRALPNSPLLANVNPNDVNLTAASAYEDDNENVYAQYVQFQDNFGPWEVLTGLRVEETRATYRAYEINNSTNEGLVARPTSYNNFFPTLQGKYTFSPELLARATYSTAIARPGFDEITASTIISNNSVTIGNPALQPTTGQNLDFTIEYYPTAGAIASAGLFAKWFKNYILPTVQQLASYPGVPPGQGIVNVTTFSNGPAHAYGAEAAFIDHFRFLPAPYDGFGTSDNITYVDSSAQIHPGVYGLLPSTSRLTWNASIFYEKGPIEVRLAADYVGQDLFGFGGTAPVTPDIYSSSRLTMDIGASYQVSRIVNVYAAVKNLLNTPLEFTEGLGQNRPIQREFYDFTFLAGLRAKF
jgi:TonB-dependent receptor